MVGFVQNYLDKSTSLLQIAMWVPKKQVNFLKNQKLDENLLTCQAIQNKNFTAFVHKRNWSKKK